MSKRYVVVKESESGHCCFQASVVDTTKPVLDGDGKPMDYDGRLHYESVCECLDIACAELIASALNKP